MEAPLTETQCRELQEWTRANRERVVADAAAGIVKAKSVIRLHKMLARHADWPTWGLFAGAVADYVNERGER